MYAIESWDALIIALYFAAIVLISLYFLKTQKETPQNYFLSDKNLGWIVIGTSLFAVNMSNERFLGLMGYGATQGIAIANFELMAIFPLILLGWFLVPLFLKSNIFTVPEFFGKRYNKSVQLYLSGMTLAFYLFIKISISVLAGSFLLNSVFDWDIYTSAIVILMITGIYTIIGGFTVVMYTSVFQAMILLIGIITLLSFGLAEVGGLSGFQQNLSTSQISMFKPMSDPDFPWTGIVFGAPILGIWYWCTDQYIVQRILGAKSVYSARNGTILTGFLKTFPVFFIVLIGLTSSAAFSNIKGEQVLSSLLYSDLLPVGFKGMVVIGVLAAMMSTLSGAFISSSTLFTMDFYRHFRPDSSNKKLVLVGRLTTIVIVICTILWIPLMKILQVNLHRSILSIHAFIGPPVAAVFILGIFWKRMNGKSAIWTLITGGIVGVLRIIFEWIDLGQDLNQPILIWIFSLNYLHFAIFLFLLSLTVATSVSLLSKSRISSKISEQMLALKEVAAIFQGKRIFSQGEKTDQYAWIFSFVLIIILFGFWGLFF